MLYVLALTIPPLACIGAGKFLHSLINSFLCLTLVGYPLAMVHAWFVVKGSYGGDGRVTVVNNLR